MAKDTSFYKKKTITFSGNLKYLDSPLVMGILNLTTDSFYAESRAKGREAILARADKLLAEGADLLDLGAYSSRPGAVDVPEEKERGSILEAIKIIKEKYPDAIVSVDTFRSGVAEPALSAGAAMVNDISGGEADERMFGLIAEAQVPYVLMHMKGGPGNMQSLAQYDDLFKEIIFYFSRKLERLKRAGVRDIIVDPGLGFAKTLGQNYEILKNLRYFEILECPLLLGVSRKSMIYKLLGTAAENALNGTTALHMHALMNGADILRVHDVREAKETIKLYQMLRD